MILLLEQGVQEVVEDLLFLLSELLNILVSNLLRLALFVLLKWIILILSFDEIHWLNIEDLVHQILVKPLPRIMLD